MNFIQLELETTRRGGIRNTGMQVKNRTETETSKPGVVRPRRVRQLQRCQAGQLGRDGINGIGGGFAAVDFLQRVVHGLENWHRKEGDNKTPTRIRDAATQLTISTRKLLSDVPPAAAKQAGKGEWAATRTTASPSPV